jgi:TonB family protein
MRDDHPEFLKLIDGEYKITITKPGFKRTVQPISFTCENQDDYAVTNVIMERGSSTITVATEKLNVRAPVPTIGSRDPSLVIGVSPAATEKSKSSSSRIVSGGVLNGKAISLPKPEYPAIARAAGASGTVVIQVTIDEEGRVISASAVSGHPLLRSTATEAARSARFSTTFLAGQPVKVTGTIRYNFALLPRPEPKAETE